jgi:hypothetical protein
MLHSSISVCCLDKFRTPQRRAAAVGASTDHRDHLFRLKIGDAGNPLGARASGTFSARRVPALSLHPKSLKSRIIRTLEDRQVSEIEASSLRPAVTRNFAHPTGRLIHSRDPTGN